MIRQAAREINDWVEILFSFCSCAEVQSVDRKQRLVLSVGSISSLWRRQCIRISSNLRPLAHSVPFCLYITLKRLIIARPAATRTGTLAGRRLNAPFARQHCPWPHHHRNQCSRYLPSVILNLQWRRKPGRLRFPTRLLAPPLPLGSRAV
jgi:hypothetical protein